MRKPAVVIATIITLLLLTACTGQAANQSGAQSNDDQNATSQKRVSTNQDFASDPRKELSDLLLTVNEKALPVTWEDNVAVSALRQQVAEGPIAVQMSMYGGNEQVGSLGRSYPTDNSQTTTHCGDIVLYSGSNIVVFYGSNDWSYTRLGKIDLPDDQVKEMLSSSGVTLVLSLESK